MNKKQKKVLIRIILSGTLFAALIILGKFTRLPVWAWFLMYMAPYIIIGYDILEKAAKGIKNRQVFDENFLMAVATLGAIGIGLAGDGDFAEAVAVMLFYQIGELFQSVAVGKSRRNITELMDIRPDYANLVTDAGTETVDPDDVVPGSIIIVSPGEKVPIDGVVIEGSSSLNTAALTGESVPRTVKPGDDIISGCVNMTGVLKIRTTKEFGESTVSKVLELVENASSKKSRSENFISRFAKVYTPFVCYAALALAVLPPLVRMMAGYDAMWLDWIYRAFTFLVISCPCAVVISIPLSFFAGIGGAGREGVLVKGSVYLEELSKVKTVVFDKTGTMTEGVFEVTKICPSEGNEADLLELAAMAECYSNHPISKSIKAAYGKEIDKGRIKNAEETGGYGVTAEIDGEKVAAGAKKLMDKLSVAVNEPSEIGTVVHVAQGGKYKGYLIISDRIKENAQESVRKLYACGVKNCVMLTGDSKKVAEGVSGALGIDRYHAELLPEDKVTIVEMLLTETAGDGKLAFVGDGINDAPVLTRADIGIAMGALGSDAAIEAADIVLMDDDPLKISKAIKISRKCMRIVYENIFFALGVKFACLVLGALGIANMWLAIFADVGVMVIAVLNAIRALFVRRL